MSIDTTFKPIGNTVVVGPTGGAVAPVDQGAYLGVTTFRVKVVVAGYLSWGPSNIPAPVAPVLGTPQPHTMGFATVGAVAYLEVPANSFFRTDGTASFEITSGCGGTGG